MARGSSVYARSSRRYGVFLGAEQALIVRSQPSRPLDPPNQLWRPQIQTREDYNLKRRRQGRRCGSPQKAH